jgi:hypothetical protein
VDCGGGCPFIDSDSDGVEDCKDECPNEKRITSNNGCPREWYWYLMPFIIGGGAIAVIFRILKPKAPGPETGPETIIEPDTGPSIVTEHEMIPEEDTGPSIVTEHEMIPEEDTGPSIVTEHEMIPEGEYQSRGEQPRIIPEEYPSIEEKHKEREKIEEEMEGKLDKIKLDVSV